MPQYLFVARDREGHTRRGTRAASSEAALVGELRSGGLLTLEIAPAASAADERIARPGPFSPSRWFSPRAIDIEVGLQQIAYMLRSGLPLLQALSTCAAQSERSAITRVWREISLVIQQGGSFSQGLAAQKCFPKLVVTMVAVGERTGELDLVLDRSSKVMERRRMLKASLLTALTYPSIVVVLTTAVVAYMMVGLIPKLKVFLAGFGRRLPPITQLLVDISTFMQAWFVPAAIVFVTTVVALCVLWRWPPGRVVIDRVLLSVPLIGRILRLAATASFARNMGLLISSGVRLTEALSVVEPVIGNAWIARRVSRVRQRVLQGAGFAEPLAASRAFGPMLSNMVAVGEASGTLDEVLENVAEFHDLRLQALIRRLSAILEPFIVIVLGAIVGFIYLAFFVAIYSIVGGR